MGVGAVALGPHLGRLDSSVDRFGKAVVQAGTEVFEDSGQILLQRSRQPLERYQPAVNRGLNRGQSALSRPGCGFRGKSTLTPDSPTPDSL